MAIDWRTHSRLMNPFPTFTPLPLTHKLWISKKTFAPKKERITTANLLAKRLIRSGNRNHCVRFHVPKKGTSMPADNESICFFFLGSFQRGNINNGFSLTLSATVWVVLSIMAAERQHQHCSSLALFPTPTHTLTRVHTHTYTLSLLMKRWRVLELKAQAACCCHWY